MSVRLSAVAAVAADALAVFPASAGASLRGAPASPPMTLPGDAASAAVRADGATWIVGARAGRSGVVAGIARSHGAERITQTAWLVPRSRARAFAGALRARRALAFSEPNTERRVLRATGSDPLTAQSGWRERVVAGAAAPAVTRSSPLIALIDTTLDVAHSEVIGSNIATAGGPALSDVHGTATATVAAAPTNGTGMEGVWPGARALNLPLPSGSRISCADSSRQIRAAVRAGAAVINMSYGGPGDPRTGRGCFAELQQLRRAIRRGVIPVAAAGNEFADGNPIEFPASWPHVLTVAATDPADRSAFFSNENAAVDLSAPGIAILAGVPRRFDADGDGFATLDGTSFAAPMVAAAIAWVRAARTDLTPYQAAEVVRRGARDVGAPGYENSTGFGVLSLPGAMGLAPPPHDPLEPNEDIRLVDGREFGRPAAPVRTVSATTDYAEDPVDVYRVKVPAGRRLALRLRARTGDPDLYVFDGRARGLREGRLLLGRSRKRTGSDIVRVRNGGRRARTVYAAVAFSSSKRQALLNASYTLTAR
jgi:hypothetical protein